MVNLSDFAIRSTTYRKEYFEKHKPEKRNKYRCAYCGYLYPKSQITIDHIRSVHSAKKSFFLRMYLKMRGYKSINDLRNLVPACEKCNKKKGAKGGFWICKGILGRHKSYWIIRRLLFICIIIATIYLICKTHIYTNIYEFVKGGVK